MSDNINIDNINIDNTGADNINVDNINADNPGVDTPDVVDNTSVDNTSVDNINVDNINVEGGQDVQNESGNPEVSSQDSEGDVKQVDSAVAAASKPSRRELKEEVKQENLQALRESRKQLQRERDDYAMRLQALEAAQSRKPIDGNTSIDEDDYVDPTQKEIKQIKHHIAEMAVNNSRMKLQTQYPDFKAIVNDESIAILKQRFPEVASTLDQSTDLYTTGVSAYNIIKKFGLNISEEEAVTNVVQKQKVVSNVAKPRPVSSMKSASALSHANDYSDLSRKEVRDEIIRIATERADGI